MIYTLLEVESCPETWDTTISWLEGFSSVPPILLGPESYLFITWSYVRTISYLSICFHTTGCVCLRLEHHTCLNFTFRITPVWRVDQNRTMGRSLDTLSCGCILFLRNWFKYKSIASVVEIRRAYQTLIRPWGLWGVLGHTGYHGCVWLANICAKGIVLGQLLS